MIIFVAITRVGDRACAASLALRWPRSADCTDKSRHRQLVNIGEISIHDTGPLCMQIYTQAPGQRVRFTQGLRVQPSQEGRVLLQAEYARTAIFSE